MTHLKDIPFAPLQFYATASYPCAYLNHQQARSQVVMHSHLMNTTRYSALIQQGFRRSGLFTYRPFCEHCQACIPVRICAADFLPTRTQRRIWKKHHALTETICHLAYKDEHYALYLRYQNIRHTGGGMDKDNRDQYMQFLLQSKINSHLIEFRDPQACNALRIVSIIDTLNDGLSAVYTFFDPNIISASFGTYAILWQIQRTRMLGLPYVYLGYWIEHSPKMAYKTRFQPLEMLCNGQWQKFSTVYL